MSKPNSLDEFQWGLGELMIPLKNILDLDHPSYEYKQNERLLESVNIDMVSQFPWKQCI